MFPTFGSVLILLCYFFSLALIQASRHETTPCTSERLLAIKGETNLIMFYESNNLSCHIFRFGHHKNRLCQCIDSSSCASLVSRFALISGLIFFPFFLYPCQTNFNLSKYVRIFLMSVSLSHFSQLPIIFYGAQHSLKYVGRDC